MTSYTTDNRRTAQKRPLYRSALCFVVFNREMQRKQFSHDKSSG